MSYFKIVKNGYIDGIGETDQDVAESITEEEYNAILIAIRNKPQSSYGVDYRLKTDLTWDQYTFTPEPVPEPDPTPEEIAEALEEIL